MAWFPAPRYVLRRYCLLRLTDRLPRGRVLEVGCGSGDLLVRLARRGWRGAGVESSKEACAEALRRTEPVRDRISILPALGQTSGLFDLLISCEVLEHIQDDRAALKDWAARLAPGGRMLISVPSHRDRWGPTDEWAGHYRRYEREDLLERVSEAGLSVERLWSYGFPLTNWVEPWGTRHYRRKLEAEASMTKSQRTARSGVERDERLRRLSFLMRPAFMLPFCWAQMLFLKTELGNGFLLQARRPPGGPLR